MVSRQARGGEGRLISVGKDCIGPDQKAIYKTGLYHTDRRVGNIEVAFLLNIIVVVAGERRFSGYKVDVSRSVVAAMIHAPSSLPRH